MKTILSILGYSWAIICMLLIPITFVGNGSFAGLLAKLDFMKVNPVFTGGSIDHVLNKGELKVEINKPIFAALIGESKEGFVQVKWVVSKELPPEIIDTIDFDNNGITDFSIKINTNTGMTEFKPLDKNVIGLRISARVKENWLVRINLRNPKKTGN